MIVFRGPEEDARGLQAAADKYTAADGFLLIGMQHEALASLIDMLGVRLVVMPESPYTGGGVHAFEAGAFVALLEESEEVFSIIKGS